MAYNDLYQMKCKDIMIDGFYVGTCVDYMKNSNNELISLTLWDKQNGIYKQLQLLPTSHGSGVMCPNYPEVN